MKGAWPCANVTARVPEIIRGFSHPLARRSAVALLRLLEEIQNGKYKIWIKYILYSFLTLEMFFNVEKPPRQLHSALQRAHCRFL